MIIVHGIDNGLLSILDNFPDCSPQHVTGSEGGDGQPLALPLELNSLTVLELGHLLKTGVHLVIIIILLLLYIIFHLVQGEQGELLDVVPRLVQVVQEHLTHLVHGHGHVDGTGQT